MIRSSEETFQCSSVHLMCHILRNVSSSIPTHSGTHTHAIGMSSSSTSTSDHHIDDSKESKMGDNKSKKSSAAATTREAFGVTMTQVAIIQLLAQLLPVLCRDAITIIIALVRVDNTGMVYTCVSYN